MKTGTALPNMGCAWEEAVAVEAAEVNMKMESNEPLVGVDDPNTIGALLVAATETEDAPKENPVDGDAELNVELNEGLVGCQVELNKLEVASLVLMEFVDQIPELQA